MSKKSYQFVFSEADERIDAFLEAQPYKNMAFKVMIYDYIRRYGYTDIVLALLYNPGRDDDIEDRQEPVEKRKRGRPRKEDSNPSYLRSDDGRNESKRNETKKSNSQYSGLDNSESVDTRERERKIKSEKLFDTHSNDSKSLDGNGSKFITTTPKVQKHDDSESERNVYDDLNDELSGAIDPFDLFNQA